MPDETSDTITDNLMVAARRILGPLWKKAQLRGRCWGLKGDGNDPYDGGNPYFATNITVARGKELVSVSRGKSGKLRIHEFSKTQDTSLGKDVKRTLEAGGFVFEQMETK